MTGSLGGFTAPEAQASGSVAWTANGELFANSEAASIRVGTEENSDAYVDGSGNLWVVADIDVDQDGDKDVTMQKFNASGARQFGDAGTLVTSRSGVQVEPKIVSDGGSGVVVVWLDETSGNSDVYAQRFNSSGAEQWTSGGVAVADGAGEEVLPGLVDDGSGNSYISWDDNTNDELRVQKLNSSGAEQWTSGGVVVADVDDIRAPVIAYDGAGGAFLAWEDRRNDGTHFGEIFASRIDSSGSQVGTTDGQVIGSNSGDFNNEAHIAQEGTGAVIVWQSDRTGGTVAYAQKIDSSVAIQWTSNGVEMGDGDPSFSSRILGDGSGGAYLVWSDNRAADGGGDIEIYVQRLNSSGVEQWTADGVRVTNNGNTQEEPRIAPDGSGGIVVWWVDERNDDGDLYGQRFNSSGAAQWTASGEQLVSGSAQQGNVNSDVFTTLVADASGNTYASYGAGSSDLDVFAQKANSSGTEQWTAAGSRMHTTGGPVEQENLRVAAVGSGNYVFVWEDSRDGSSDKQIYAQKLDSDGDEVWTAGGIAINTDSGNQERPRVAPDGSGGAYISWLYSGVYRVTRVNSAGSFASGFSSAGVAVSGSDSGSVDTNVDLIPDGSGNVFIVYNRDDSGCGGCFGMIYANKVSSDGSTPWGTTGVAVSDTNFDGYTQGVGAADGAGGLLVAWKNSSPAGIHVSRLDGDGSLESGWTADGDSITTSSDASLPAIASDGAGGAIVAFQDDNGGNDDIKVQRLNGSGTVQWTAGGVTVGGATGNQQQARVIASGSNGAVIAWLDYRSGSADIYAQRVNSSGVAQWTANGNAITAATGDQGVQSYAVASDGSDGIIAAWVDERAGGSEEDVYAQRLDASGDAEWTADGLAIATRSGKDEQNVDIVSNGDLGAVISFDTESSPPDGGAQQVEDSEGSGGGSTNDPTLNNAATLSRHKAGESSTFALSFTLQNEITGTLTVTFPSQFSLTGAFTSGTCASGTIGTFAFDNTAKTLTAEKSACSGAVSVSGATITLPSSPGVYTVSWTNDDPGETIIPVTDDDQVSVSAQVDETMTFDLDTGTTTSADSSAPYAVALGELSTSSVTSSGDGTVHMIGLDIDTNASAGAVVQVRNANGSSGLVSSSAPSDTIDAVSSTTLAAGTEGYGICVYQVSATTGTFESSNYHNGGTLSASNGTSTSTTCDSSTHQIDDALSTTFTDILDSNSAGVAGARGEVFVKASVSDTTAAHDDYSDTLTFRATATF